MIWPTTYSEPSSQELERAERERKLVLLVKAHSKILSLESTSLSSKQLRRRLLSVSMNTEALAKLREERELELEQKTL